MQQLYQKFLNFQDFVKRNIKFIDQVKLTPFLDYGIIVPLGRIVYVE